MGMVGFNIKAKSGYYFKCKIFDTKPEMYTYYRDYLTKNSQDIVLKPDFAAIVMPYERYMVKSNKQMQLQRDIGEALFYKGRLGAGLVAHECLHMSLHHDRFIEGNHDANYTIDCGRDEERLAYCLTEFVRRFTIACFKRKIYG